MPDVNVYEPCEPWVTRGDLTCEVPPAPVPPAEDHVSWAIDVASEVLNALSGRQFGVCSRTETVQAPDACLGPVPVDVAARLGYPDLPVAQRVLRLTGTPVQSVTSVTEDGETLTAGEDYRVDDWQLLVRVGAVWSGEVVTSYRYGSVVPEMGRLAAAELACELAKAITADRSCRLPARVQDVSQRGMTVRFIDPMDFIDRGRTGLVLCDLFLAAVNPHGLSSRSRIVNPDDLVNQTGGRFRGTSGTSA